jgi:hypothetical protein
MLRTLAAASLNQTEEERKPSKSLDYQPIAVDAVDRGLLEQSKFNRTRVVRNIWTYHEKNLSPVHFHSSVGSGITRKASRIRAWNENCALYAAMRISIERTSGMPQPKQVLFCQHNSSADGSWLVEPFAQLERKRWVIWNIDFICEAFLNVCTRELPLRYASVRRGSMFNDDCALMPIADDGLGCLGPNWRNR